MKNLTEKSTVQSTAAPGQVAELIDRLRGKSDHEIAKAAMSSKGNVTRVEGYDNLSRCISRLSAIDGGRGTLGKALRDARAAETMLLRQRPTFEKAFAKGGSEASRLIYVGIVASLWHTVTLLCAEGVIFVKGADGRYQPVANAAGADAVATGVPATRLARFVEAADKYGFQQTVTETARALESELLGEVWSVIAIAAGGAVALVALLGLAREMAEYYYRLRGTFARWLDLQASFLDMNASALGVDKSSSRDRQEQYAKRLRAIADSVRVDNADAEKGVRQTLAAEKAITPSPNLSIAQSGGSVV
jgi:hypothetical protein